MQQKMRPRKKTKQHICDVRDVLKLVKCGVYVAQQFRQFGDPMEGQFSFKNGRIYCPKKRGEKIFIRYTTVCFEEI